MAAATTQVTISWKDKLGKLCKVVLHVAAAIQDPANATIQAILTLIKAISGALDYKIALSGSSANAGTLGTGAYNTVQDKAQLTFHDNEGKAHNYRIPGLKAAILQTNQEQINMSNPLVSAWVAAVTANAKTPNNQPLVSCISGIRLMKKTQKH